MLRLSLIWIIIAFSGCATPTPLSNDAYTSKVVPNTIKPNPDINIPHIRINPNLRLPFKEQLEWQKRLHKMPPAELWKLRRALEDGMFSDPETLMRRGQLYPRGYGDKDV